MQVWEERREAGGGGGPGARWGDEGAEAHVGYVGGEGGVWVGEAGVEYVCCVCGGVGVSRWGREGREGKGREGKGWEGKARTEDGCVAGFAFVFEEGEEAVADEDV